MSLHMILPSIIFKAMTINFEEAIVSSLSSTHFLGLGSLPDGCKSAALLAVKAVHQSEEG